MRLGFPSALETLPRGLTERPGLGSPYGPGGGAGLGSCAFAKAASSLTANLARNLLKNIDQYERIKRNPRGKARKATKAHRSETRYGCARRSANSAIVLA